MALSKKHYEQFALRFRHQLAEIAGNTPSGLDLYEHKYAREQLAQLAGKLAIDFGYDNPRFDKLRFLEACGF